MAYLAKDDLSQFLYKLTLMYSNMNEFINKFSQSLTTSRDAIDVNFTTAQGETQTTSIPSVGHLKGRIDSIDATLKSLINANDDTVTLKFADGSVKSFDMIKISQLVTDLEAIKDQTFDVPTSFRVKNNWFFESFLNPMLYVTVDVTDYIQDGDVDRFSVRRVILNTKQDSDVQYFDANMKGKSDLDYDSTINALAIEGIDYAFDDEMVDMPTAINKNRGSFTVIAIHEDDVETDNGVVARRRYELDVLTYRKIVNDKETLVYLDVNDVLLTMGDTEYKVLSIDRDTNMVTLELSFGSDPISIGTDVLKIKPDIYRSPDLNVNVGYDEREIIFVRPVSRKHNMSTDKFSKGFAFYTNELSIQLSTDKSITLEEYYANFVADFGKALSGFAKEKQIPAVDGIIPDAPVLSADNFSVVMVNRHIVQDSALTQLREKIAAKDALEAEINELNKSINDLKTQLNSSNNLTNIQRQQIEKQINEKAIKKANGFNQLSTIVSEITLGLKANPEFTVKPKYRVRGFIPLPSAKVGSTGSQEVIQMIVSYRYLSKKGTAANVDQFKSTTDTGTEQIDFYSPWIEVESKIRSKELVNGVYVWSAENTQDPDVVNINQVDIPVRKGESVEIRAKSVSEAGFPINPIKSDWSNSVVIDFPNDLSSTQEFDTIYQDLMLEDVKIKFEQDLNSKGLDLHLQGSVTKGDTYYAHASKDLASGFFTTEGNIINLFEVIKDLRDRVQALEAAIESDRGVMSVTIRYPNGYVSKVKQGDLISIFAGNYLDDIKSVSQNQNVTYNWGEIISKTYVINIANSSKTPLELVSRLIGGIDEMVNASDGSPTSDEDYNVNRKYDIVPISVITQSTGVAGGFKQKAPFQCGQAKSQFIYVRQKDYGLQNDLYVNPADYDFSTLYYAGYKYDGINPITSPHLIPYNWAHYLPYMPTSSSDENVWNGTSTGGVANGNGELKEFCIHKNHPIIQSVNVSSTDDFHNFLFPAMSWGTSTVQKYPTISHSLYFNQAEGETSLFDSALGIQAKSYQQMRMILGGNSGSGQVPTDYPIKLGFAPDDKYLIGKYTCGSYLFMGPITYADISVEGNHPKLAKRKIEYGDDHSINIPIIFQYRCADILEYVGGFRSDETLSNVKYSKKIGIDIYEKLNSSDTDTRYGDVFSFDIEVYCQYKKETATDAPVNVSGVGASTTVTYTQV